MSDAFRVYVADSSAMIAFLRQEPGGEVFLRALAPPEAVCYAHGVQLAEVFYDFLRQGGEKAAY